MAVGNQTGLCQSGYMGLVPTAWGPSSAGRCTRPPLRGPPIADQVEIARLALHLQEPIVVAHVAISSSGPGEQAKIDQDDVVSRARLTSPRVAARHGQASGVAAGRMSKARKIISGLEPSQ